MLPLTPDMSRLDRMVLSVERVRDRLSRACAALEAAGIPYAVADGNAVAAWVATIDAAAVRNTQDVDLLLRRADLDKAAAVLEKAGFLRRHVAGLEIFLDGPDAKARDAVHIVLAGEKVRPEYPAPAPDITETSKPGSFSVLSLEALVSHEADLRPHRSILDRPPQRPTRQTSATPDRHPRPLSPTPLRR